MFPKTRWSTLTLALVVATACSKDTMEPTATVRMPNASYSYAAPTGIAVDSVVGMTVYAQWQDNSADNGGFYLVLSDAANVQSTKKYQLVYGGNTTSGSITAYSNEKGCYLVSVFAWGGSDTDSAWSTVGPVGIGGATCSTGTTTNSNGKGKGRH
jgi:hypothetical protein